MRPRQIISKLLNTISGSKPSNPVSVVPQRFLQAFRDHGIDPVQIPRLLPQIDLPALTSEATLLPCLTPDVLDATANLFGIRSEWLEGIDDTVYDYTGCYKEPKILLEHLAALTAGKNVRHEFPVRVLSTAKELDPRYRIYLAPVLLEKIDELGEDPIYRCHVYRDGFDWSYAPARIELKAIARIAAKRVSMVIPLHVISDKEMEDVLAGRVIPFRHLGGCQITDPSLEDYVLDKKESAVAKEIDELPTVLRYIEENHLERIEFHLGSSNAGVTSQQDVELPPLDFILETPEPSIGNATGPQSPDWITHAHNIADELDAKDASCGAYDSLRGMAARVAKNMRERKIHGPRGPLSEGTILRDALQAGKWKRRR